MCSVILLAGRIFSTQGRKELVSFSFSSSQFNDFLEFMQLCKPQALSFRSRILNVLG